MAAIAVIVASSGQSDPAKGITAKASATGGQTEAGDLSGVLADCGKMHGWLVGRMGVHVGDTAFLASPNPQVVTKARVIREIQRAVSSTYETIIIYCSGHGEPLHGSWTFDNGQFLSPAEVFELIPAKRQAIIISDTCFSGKWVGEAERQRGNHKILWVQASCDASSVSWVDPEGGVFTRHFLEADHGEDVGVVRLFDRYVFKTPRFVFKAFANLFRSISSPTCFNPTNPSFLAQTDGYLNPAVLSNGKRIICFTSWADMCS